MSPDSAPGALGRFRDWRRSRPFWGGLLVLVAGLEIIYLPLSPISQLIAAGVVGAQSILVGFLIIVLGPFIWFSPANRTLAGVLAIIFSISSLVLSNLGGLVIGMMIGIIGGALTLAWTDQPKHRRRRPGPPQPSSLSSADTADVDEPTDSGIAIVRPSPTPRPAPPPPASSTSQSRVSALSTARVRVIGRVCPVFRSRVSAVWTARVRGWGRVCASSGSPRRLWRRRAAAVGVLVGLTVAWSSPAMAAPSSSRSSAEVASRSSFGVPPAAFSSSSLSRLTSQSLPLSAPSLLSPSSLLSQPSLLSQSATMASPPPRLTQSSTTSPPVPSPTPDCVAALAALPSELLGQLLPGLQQLMPELTRLLPDLARLVPGLLGGPPPPRPTADEVRTRQLVAAQTCALPQLLPVGPDGKSLPQLPWLPQLPLPSLPLLPLSPAPRPPTAPLVPGLPLPSLPLLPNLPLPALSPLVPELPGLPLPELPLPELPRLPLPTLPIPQLPELPFPELPGLPGLPGVDPPPDAGDLPLPVEPSPDAKQTIVQAEDSEVTPTVTSTLTMATLTVESLVYQGIVELPTAAGGVVRALRFTMATIDADELRIGVPTSTGRQIDLDHVSGNHVVGTGVTLDCTSLSLIALGVLPLTFTLDAPPPPLLALPSLYSTDVDIDLVTLKLQTLSVPTATTDLSGPGTDDPPPPDTSLSTTP